MQRKNYKGRKIKNSFPKFEGVCVTYNTIQLSYAVFLSKHPDIKTAQSNVLLTGFPSDKAASRKTGRQRLSKRSDR